MGLSAVCDCGISRLYSLTIFIVCLIILKPVTLYKSIQRAVHLHHAPGTKVDCQSSKPRQDCILQCKKVHEIIDFDPRAPSTWDK